MNVLLIAEKPSVANRLADALGEGKGREKKGKGRISYYEINNDAGTMYVAAAVGHLFTIKQSDKGRGYPVLDVEWAPSYLVDKKADYTRDYLELLEELGKKCEKFINACDFDIEGTVIGTNIIKYVNKGNMKNAERMKFSTTTTEDLLYSYSHMMPLDVNNFNAGEARHMLDWLWGINLSRALTYAIGRGTYGSHALSIGRVQGPALAILAKREREIAKFVSQPFWRIFASIKGVDFLNTRGDIFDKPLAEGAFRDTETNKQNAIIEDIESREQSITPYPPFDLTTLQLEASRALHLDPTMTLSIAQSLYEKSYISYPRTSSQKLPASLDLPKIIMSIAKNPDYSELARKLVEQKRYKPFEGSKTDEAHPSIFPTGVIPRSLSQVEAKLYDLIVRRFMACFAEPATVARGKVTAKLGNETYAASGARIMSPGWLSYYTYAKIDEKMLPPFKKGAVHQAASVDLKEMQTQPPKRYSKAGLISELEKRDLGTKATRAQIIDTLFKRKYIEGTSIHATEFGLSVYDSLEKNCNMIVDEETTRKLEEDMTGISKGEIKEEQVIEEGKEMLLKAIEQFNSNKDHISEEMRVGLRKASIMGKCVRDGGDLVIRRSKTGKQFVACANYPACTNTYSLPQSAMILPTGEVCEHCHTPIIKVIRKGRRPFEMDLDSTCITKKNWAGYKSAADIAAEKAAAAAVPSVPAVAVVSAANPAETQFPAAKQAEKPSVTKAVKPRMVKAKAKPKTKAKKKVKQKIGDIDVPA